MYLDQGVEYQITKVREDGYIELRVPNVSYKSNLIIKKTDFEKQFYENIFNQGLIAERQKQDTTLQSTQTAQTPRAEEAQSDNVTAIYERAAGADAQSVKPSYFTSEEFFSGAWRTERSDSQIDRDFLIPKIFFYNYQQDTRYTANKHR